MARLPAYKRTGVITEAELKRAGMVPPAARLKQGSVVMIECVEEIPCNPCADACPRKAISVAPRLVDLPKVDYDRCNGCTICVARCPGLAIFVLDLTVSKTHATVTLPYELLPRPQKGERVAALDRAGKRVCDGTVTRVIDTKATDRCAVVTVRVPKKYWNRVRSIRVRRSRS